MSITSLAQVERIIGARGLDPRNRNLTDFELIDRLDGQGIVLKFWDEAALGALPNAAEIALAASPKISLGVATNGAGDGIIVTATLTNGTNQTVNWRCIDPDSLANTATGNAVAGAETWEIITGKAGKYIIQAWAETFGFTQLEYTEV